MKHTQDHFSPIASGYAQGRICYPEELYRFLSAECGEHELAWDCATGSGQAAQDLTRTFSRVIATDISEELLALAPPSPRISYRMASAEESGIDPDSVDLITVAQALHWFDLTRFWPEVTRILKKGGVIAFWGYTWPIVEPEIDRVLEQFKAVISSSWPDRSSLLHGGYRSIRAPLRELPCPAFEASASWVLDDYLAHLRSWSAVRYYHERTGENVTERFRPAFAEAWAWGGRSAKWPLIVRVFKKE